MNQFKKFLSMALVAALLVGTTAGCSGGGSGSASGAASSQAGSTAGGSASGDVLSLKLGMVDSDKSNYYKGMQTVAQNVSDATDGKIKITVYPSSQLGSERDMFEGCELGSIDICSAVNSVMTEFIPQMNVLDQPYLFDTTEQANKVIDGQLGDLIAKEAEAKGVHIVGWMESGFRNVFADRPIKTLADFKGLKIRTMENEMQIAAFNATGAIATPMAAGDVFTGLQQKTIDAAENATSNVLANNYYEITPYITRTQHLFTFISLGVSDKAWNKIPDDLKDKFVEAVKKGCVAQRQYLLDANADAEKQLAGKGVQFFDIDRDSIKNAMAPAMEKYQSKMDPQWLSLVKAG